jgi:hypothetical protein
MKKKRLFHLLTFTGVIMLVSTSCKKDDNNDNNNPPAGYVPTIAALPATNITSTTAVIDVAIGSDGGQTITARGVCWSTGIAPTISDSKTFDGTGAGNFTSNIAGLSPSTTYYFRAYATNIIGTGYSSAYSFTTSALTYGDNFQGGLVAYIFQPSDPGYVAGQTHGLIAAPTDQSNGVAWYNGAYTTTGATSVGIGSGNANTNTIVNNQGTGNYAAKLCSDLVLGGYDDWYLPSKGELYQLYSYQGYLNISQWQYWSSTEYNSTDAMAQNFANGYQINVNKNTSCHVRAVRTF